MSFNWKDLTSKSDNFFTTLPLFNKEGSLEDKYSFSFTARPKNGSYSLSANHTDGKRGKVQFAASETYTNYYNTELGYKINNKPGVQLTAKLTDSLIRLEGASVDLNFSAVQKEERATVQFNYANKTLNLVLGASVPLPHRLFNLPTQEGDVNHNKLISTQVVYRISESRDYHVGVDATYALPNENETPKYDVRGVIATKNDNYEGGFFVRRSVGEVKSEQYGAYSTSVTGNLTLSSHFAYDRVKDVKERFTLDNFVSFPGSDGSNYLFGVQVSPKTSVSFGVERNITSNTRVSFAYAYVISHSNTEEKFKRSAVRFGLELSN